MVTCVASVSIVVDAGVPRAGGRMGCGGDLYVRCGFVVLDERVFVVAGEVCNV